MEEIMRNLAAKNAQIYIKRSMVCTNIRAVFHAYLLYLFRYLFLYLFLCLTQSSSIFVPVTLC